MFTGIITNATSIVGHQKTKDGVTITFKKPSSWTDLELGESVATDGACLTVAAIRAHEFDCQLVPETLAKTSFGHQLPARVNLERSLNVKDRFGGHFVQGHVDSIGTVARIDKTAGYRLDITFPAENQGLVMYKGSITINGVALTITSITGNTLGVALVPHTLKHTTLSALEVGDEVNLEFDMIGKYIAKIMENHGTERPTS
jgi:riboflavin synthase